jgi:hypothetical protein
MDTSPGRTRARVAEAKDFLPGGNRYEQRVGGTEKEDTPEDLSKRTDKGKSSHVSFVVNLVTSQETADRSDMETKGPNVRTKDHHKTTWHQQVPDKSTRIPEETFKV